MRKSNSKYLQGVCENSLVFNENLNDIYRVGIDVILIERVQLYQLVQLMREKRLKASVPIEGASINRGKLKSGVELLD